MNQREALPLCPLGMVGVGGGLGRFPEMRTGNNHPVKYGGQI